MLRLLKGVHGIADYILTHEETEIQHDGKLLTLQTARMNNLSLNPEKIQFKSTDCKFFGHTLNPEVSWLKQTISPHKHLEEDYSHINSKTAEITAQASTV